MLHTTFALVRKHDFLVLACQEGVDAMRAVLGPDWGDDQPIPLTRIALEGRGIDDALWCLHAVPLEEEAERDRIAQLLSAHFAEHVLPYYEAAFPGDESIRVCIETVRRCANGQANMLELAGARALAGDAKVSADAAARAARATTTSAKTADAIDAAFWAAAAVAAAAGKVPARSAKDAADAATEAAAWLEADVTEKQWQLETFLRYMREEENGD